MVKIIRKTSKGVYFTPKGLTSAREELQTLKGEKRREIAERIQRAREYGDLAENSEYDAAMEEQTFVEGRIAELEGFLKEAKVITEAPNNDFVVIGSNVVIEMEGEEDEFTIVGRVEADLY
ncbi:MAG: transcription elongation factor GreA, partial [Microgenomates group bacterium Gr01-1014_80]